jgi:TM2 domain-containing membrane protein YozV
MKRQILALALLLITVATFARVDNYKINDATVDALFENATDVTLLAFNDINSLALTCANNRSKMQSSEKNPVIAWLLTHTIFIGLPGIHRLYLGTEIITFMGYFCTVGGCGIVQTIDWVVLLIGVFDDDIDSYIDNSKFFMW